MRYEIAMIIGPNVLAAEYIQYVRRVSLFSLIGHANC